MRTTILAACLIAAGMPLAGHAADWRPDALTVKGGVGDSHATMIGAGLRWDWDFWRLRRKSELTAHTEVMLNEWRAEKPDANGYRYYTQLVLLPSLRMRLARGASPWFLEVGIGLSWMSHKLQTPDRQFGSEWNFYDVLGAGYTFGGPQGKHEVDLRLVHFSNAGLKDPNPGLNFVQVRYTREF